MKNIVLDTNVLISGILWRGLPYDALNKALSSYRLVQCPETLTEIEAVLSRGKFKAILNKRQTSVEMIMETLLSQCELYTISDNTKEKLNSVTIDDKDDLVFIGLALETKAKIIVSGDDHLLKLKQALGVDILSVSDFVNIS